MPVIKKADIEKVEKKDLNKVSPIRIQQISEAAKTEEETKVPVSEGAEDKKENTTVASEESKTDVEKKPAKQKEEQINIKLPADVKIKWRKFFMDSNINITQGIIFAVENLIKEVDEGETTLTRGGVYKKK